MKHIYTRSPFYTQLATAQTGVTMQLRVWTGDQITNRPALASYTLYKEQSGGYSTFEIAELIRDYQQHTTDVTTGFVWVEVSLDDSVAAPTVTTYTSSEGYTLYSDGIQADTTLGGDDIVGLPIDTDGSYRVLLPNSTTGVVPFKENELVLTNLTDFFQQAAIGASATSITVNSATVHVDRIDDNKWTVVKVLFLNAKGFKQEFYFPLKSMESLATSSDSFSRSLVDYNNLNNGSGLHATRKRLKSTKQSFTVNTDFIKEYYVKQIEELFLSEYVWLQWHGTYVPVNVVNSSLTKKQHINDRLIQYEFNLETASDYLNLVR